MCRCCHVGGRDLDAAAVYKSNCVCVCGRCHSCHTQRVCRMRTLAHIPQPSNPLVDRVTFTAPRWRANLLASWNKEHADGTPATELAHTTCTFCLATPGYHALRQVGIDDKGRAVLYATFSQANAYWYTSQDVVAHMPALLENAAYTLQGSASSFVLVVDHSGFGLGSCSPALARSIMSMRAAHFPGRLSRVYLGKSAIASGTVAMQGRCLLFTSA